MNPRGFPIITETHPGVRYAWVHPTMIDEYQDKGFIFTNNWHEDEDGRFQLMTSGSPTPGLAPGMVQADVVIAIPDVLVSSPDVVVQPEEPSIEEATLSTAKGGPTSEPPVATQDAGLDTTMFPSTEDDADGEEDEARELDSELDL